MKRYLVPALVGVVLGTILALVLRHPSGDAESSSRSPAVDFEADREMNARRVLGEHVALAAQHGSEANQEQHVRAALGALSETMKHAFSVESVDCRTGSCVARLTWPNEAAARRDASSLTGGSGTLRCAREIAFPPAEGAGPYTATLYLDCAGPTL
jgi:hypothetical protein